MRNITFLFGAGAEQGLGLSGGKDFALNILSIKEEANDVPKINEALELYYKDRVKDLDWYPNYRSDSLPLIKLARASIKKKILEKVGETDSMESNDNLNRRNKSDVEKEIDEICNSLYVDVTNKVIDIDKCHEKINQSTSYMGILDGYFHTLISPVYLGPNNFWKVVNCYNRAYLLLARQMIYSNKKEISQAEYLSILKNPLKSYHDMCDFGDNLKEKESYYKIIRNHFSETEVENNIRVITANYTPLCEKIADIPPKNIAYVHGKLGWFEIPDKLEVFDISNYEKTCIDIEKEIFFPYIFIQSGIKPIVEEKQLREYSKMLSFLDETDVLCILGYRINIDDNHLNAVIRSYIIKKQKVIFFDYDERGKENVLKSLKIFDKATGEYLEYIQVDKSNPLSTFEKELKRITTTETSDSNIEKEPVGV